VTVSLKKRLTNFSADMTGEQTFTLSDFAGKSFVLYFYPKDNTPGCTTESIAFRDLYDEFKAAGVEVFGLSRDSIRSHENLQTV
jgi:peroxiredoxin Q/BCP